MPASGVAGIHPDFAATTLIVALQELQKDAPSGPQSVEPVARRYTWQAKRLRHQPGMDCSSALISCSKLARRGAILS